MVLIKERAGRAGHRSNNDYAIRGWALWIPEVNKYFAPVFGPNNGF